VPDTKRRLETKFEPSVDRAWRPEGLLGVLPELFSSVARVLAQDRFLRLGLPESGGDEETRTPDPLLAKEMLCQLSYVPWCREAIRWWAFLDSNQRPLPYQGSALTS
jgi:hypothetical protein